MFSKKVSAWISWVIVSFFYAYQYVLRVIPNVMIDDIINRFNIDAALFGQFSGVYYLGYAVMHIPLGIMLDRFGPKKIMPIFIIITMVGMLPLIVADFWIYPIIGRFLIGMGSSSAILGVFKMVRLSFNESRFTMMLSWSVTIGLMGAIYGGAPVYLMKEHWGFEQVIYILIGVGLLLAAVSYYCIPHHTDDTKNSSMIDDIKEVVTNKRVLVMCVLAGMMVGPLEGFADVWGSTFLQTVYGVDKTQASSLPSFMYIGMAVGGPILSALASMLKNSLQVVWGCAVGMALSFMWLVSGAAPHMVFPFLFFFVGMLCAYQILAIYEVSTYVKPQTAGLSTAIANMIIMTFGYIFHACMGVVIDVYAGAAGLQALNSPQALMWGVAVIPAALAMSAVGIGAVMVLKR